MKKILKIHKKFKKDSFDSYTSQFPPFGAIVKNSEKDYMNDYEFGKNKNKTRKTQKTELMFIERCIDFVKPGTGKIAIVLPDGGFN